MQIIGKDQGLKLLGVLFMVVDHVGAILLPEFVFLRVIGRLSFPIFAYECAKGAVFSRNIPKYMARLALFSLVSQFPYYLCFGYGNLNIGFTLLYGVICCDLWGKSGKYRLFSVMFFAASFWMPFLNYGAYGIAAIFLFYIFYNDKIYASIAFLTATFVYSYSKGIYVQLFAAFSLVPVYLVNILSVKLPKYFFYVFYPAHLFVIYGIKLLIT